MDRLRASVAAANRKTLILMASSAAALILLALLLGFVISWSFILPVQEAHGFLSQVAKGNFGATINVPNRDEFGALADHMNHMSRELQRLSESQRRGSHELQRLNEQLQQASKAKSDFLANMSHELRTPMNAILGFVEMVLDEIYGDVPVAFGDGRRIWQCLTNLVGNALKFSKGGRVAVWVEQQGENLLYRVSDTGIGIPKNELENIFNEFQQVDMAMTREFAGTGLGLNITKKFVEMHGGRIWVESELG